MQKFFSFVSLLLLIGTGVVQAQVNIQINGSRSFVLNENNGLYFYNDSLAIDGEVFSLDDIQVITLQPTAGIANIEQEKMELMPNPVRENFVLQGIGSEPQMVVLYSVSGVKLMEQQANDGTIINIGSMPDGVYIMRCGNRAAKVVKQN